MKEPSRINWLVFCKTKRTFGDEAGTEWKASPGLPLTKKDPEAYH
jgi:hypothetical protein